MRLNSVAKRYAQALFNEAKQQDKISVVMKDLDFFENLSIDYDMLRDVLLSPVVSNNKKKDVVSDLFGKYIDELTLNCLKLMIDKNREEILPYFHEEFLKIYNEYNSLSNLVIESVILLNEEQKAQIKSIMEKKFNKTLTVTNVINKDLMGGCRLIMDDTVLDGSVKSKLSDISESLVN